MMPSSLSEMDLNGAFRPEDLSKTDFFDFVTGTEQPTTDQNRLNNNVTSASSSQPLQCFDQFWGTDMNCRTNTQEDNNLFNWSQSDSNLETSVPISQKKTNTDGHIYSITLLNNSTEQWMHNKESTNPMSPLTDLGNVFSHISNSIKSESLYCTHTHETEDLELHESLIKEQHIHILPELSHVTTPCNELQNNEESNQQPSTATPIWQSSNSFLRCALQGKGYVKGIQELSDKHGHTHTEKEINAAQAICAYTTGSIVLTDYGVSTPFVEELSITSTASQSAISSSSIIVDDMFSTLDNLSSDYEKIKRIATEVHQFCADNINLEIIDTSDHLIQPLHQKPYEIGSVDSTLSKNSFELRTKPIKKCKTTGLNNNSLNMNNLNEKFSNIKNIDNSSIDSNKSLNNHTFISNQLNMQRKERSLHYCTICSKGFKDKYSVNVHIRTHTGEKPFTCVVCSKSFRQKAHLAKHYQTHVTQKNLGNHIKNKSSKNTSHLPPTSFSKNITDNIPSYKLENNGGGQNNELITSSETKIIN